MGSIFYKILALLWVLSAYGVYLEISAALRGSNGEYWGFGGALVYAALSAWVFGLLIVRINKKKQQNNCQ
jgi:hypothetical protein